MAVKNYGIRDQWTNLDKLNNVDIKSVDGVVESVKINGEEAGGGGSSDFSTAKVTFNVTPPQGVDITMLSVIYYFAFTLNGTNYVYQTEYIEYHDSLSIPMVLFPQTGDNYLSKNALGFYDAEFNAYFIQTMSVSGNATINEDKIIITGDCTVTATIGEL